MWHRSKIAYDDDSSGDSEPEPGARSKRMLVAPISFLKDDHVHSGEIFQQHTNVNEPQHVDKGHEMNDFSVITPPHRHENRETASGQSTAKSTRITPKELFIETKESMASSFSSSSSIIAGTTALNSPFQKDVEASFQAVKSPLSIFSPLSNASVVTEDMQFFTFSPRRMTQKAVSNQILNDVLKLVGESITKCNMITIQKIRSIKLGEQLHELLQAILKDLQLHYQRLQIHASEEIIEAALKQLQTSMVHLQPLLQRVHTTKYGLNYHYQRHVNSSFQEMNTAYSKLFMELSIVIAQASKNSLFPAALESINTIPQDTSEEGQQLCLLGNKLYFGHGKDRNNKEAVAYYHMAAECGDAEAMNLLGHIYKKGEVVDQSLEKSLHWFRLAEEKGSTDGIYNLAVALREKADHEKLDLDRQQELYGLSLIRFRSLAEKGHVNAQVKLGQFYELGLSGSSDPVTASEWYKKAASKGNTQGQLRLGSLYFRGMGVPHDVDSAVHFFEFAASNNEPTALNNLGICYETGQGVRKNLDTARRLYRQASELGNVHAKNNYGYALMQHASSESCRQDPYQLYAQAMKLFLEAAEENVVDAYYNLGFLLEGGGGYIKDIRASLRYYQMAADASPPHIKAAKKAAAALYSGSVDQPDFVQAHHYYSIAAGENDPEALNNLGTMYEEGIGCQRSLEKALECFTVAANQNDADGHFNLACLYYKGVGVAKSQKEAMHHFSEANNLGHLFALKYLQQEHEDHSTGQKDQPIRLEHPETG